MPDPFSDPYVTVATWAAPAGRPDHIDEVADAFERPSGHDVATTSGAAAFWARDGALLWPRATRGWKTRDPFGVARSLERRAG